MKQTESVIGRLTRKISDCLAQEGSKRSSISRSTKGQWQRGQMSRASH